MIKLAEINELGSAEYGENEFSDMSPSEFKKVCGDSTVPLKTILIQSVQAFFWLK